MRGAHAAPLTLPVAMDYAADQMPLPIAVPQSKVFAVVVSYNGRGWLKSCLESLADSQYPVRIIVVDNASTDGTVRFISEYPDVVCVQNDSNIGFGLANNIGVRLALDEGADYVFLLNQDAYVEPSTIEKLVQVADQHRDYGILSPMHLNGGGTGFDPLFAKWVAQGAPSYYSDLYLGATQSIYSIGYVNAAAWLISHDCLKKVGGFDPLFQMYEEDVDYCRRVQNHDFKVGIVPSAIIMHSRGRNSPSYANDWDRRRSNLERLSQRLRNRNILRLKEPKKSFVHQCAACGIDFVRDVFQDMISGNVHGCIVSTMGFMRTLFSLPQISRHRRLSQTEGGHWL